MGERFSKLWFRISARRDLTMAAKVIYSILANRIGNNGRCWPGTHKLAAEAGCNPSTIIETVQRLEDVGLLTVERRNGATNVYRLCDGDPPPPGTTRKPRAVEPHGKPVRSKPSGGAGEPHGKPVGGTRKTHVDHTENPCGAHGKPVRTILSKTQLKTHDNTKGASGAKSTRKSARKTKRKKAPSGPFLGNPPPAVLDTPEFHTAWGDWTQHRREIKHPLTAGSVKAQLGKLAEEGPERSIYRIRTVIANGWRGLFQKSLEWISDPEAFAERSRPSGPYLKAPTAPNGPPGGYMRNSKT